MSLRIARKDLPVALEAKVQNRIAKETSDKMAERLTRLVQSLNESGLPTMRSLDGRGRLAHYTEMTGPQDFSLLMDPDYLEKRKAGLLPELVSPRWLALSAIPELFESRTADFRRLYESRVLNGE